MLINMVYSENINIELLLIISIEAIWIPKNCALLQIQECGGISRQNSILVLGECSITTQQTMLRYQPYMNTCYSITVNDSI